jgi:hypothetical protein
MAYQSALQAIARQKAAAKLPATPKPRDMNDPYDPELAAASKALYPSTFTPPAIGAPGFDDYFGFVFGTGTAQKLEQDVYKKNAPSYLRVFNSIKGQPENLDQYIVNELKNLTPIGTIKQNLASGTVKTPTGEIITGVLAPADYNALVSTYANELDKAEAALGTVYKDYLTSTVNSSPEAKNYLAGLPDTKLKYGPTDNFAKGEISWKTHPEVDKYLKTPEYQALQPKIKSIASGKLGGYSYGNDPRMSPEMNKQAATQNTAALNKVVAETKGQDEESLFKEFSTSKANPYRDEAIRRQSLKKKSYKP